jgi:hypothetical protein
MLEITKDMLDALAWFRDNDIPATIDDGSLFIEVNSYEIMVDSSEVSYRAELWKEYNNEGADTPS